MPTTIKKGATGGDVTLLQQCLHRYGYRMAVDGVFGPITDATVRRFQHIVGISVDGVVGPVTWRYAQRTPDRLGELLRGNGIRMPELAVAESVRTDTRLACACVLLVKESGGGMNVYGHDPVSCDGTPRGGPVTEEDYQANRSRCGAQGVGPMQLTWPGFQGRADEQGGCWRPGGEHPGRLGHLFRAPARRWRAYRLPEIQGIGSGRGAVRR